MAYTPIGWTESTPVNATNLDKMDGQIDTNENDITNIKTGSMWPIGSIYINANTNTNPATLLGFGTWQRFGQGRVLVSQDSTDADFDTAGETGGEKNHQLTEAEMPVHNHPINFRSGQAGTTNIINISNLPTTQGKPDITSSTGGDQPHNNLQPYITVYMWVRTA